MLMKFRVITGALWNAVNSGFTFLLSIATVSVLARLLTPADFGFFAMIMVVINMLESFSDMGVSAAVISYKDVKEEELASLFYFNIFFGLGLTFLLIIASPLIVSYFKKPELYPYLWLIASYFTITSPAILFNVLMRKKMRFDMLSKISMITTLVYSVAVIVYVYFSRQVLGLVFGMLMQALVSTGLNIYFGLQIWKPQRLTFRFRHVRRFVSFGVFQIGSRVINRFNQNIDFLLIGAFLGEVALGYYSMAYNLMVKPIQRINPIITSVAFPALVEVSDDGLQLKRYYLKMIRYIGYIMVPIYFLFFVLAKDIILFLYGEKWLLSVPVLQVCAFLGVLYALGNPMGNLILAKGRADIGFYNDLAKTLIIVTANFIGLQWGITGVAISTLCTIIFIVEPANFFLRRYLANMGIGEYLDEIKKTLLFCTFASVFILLGIHPLLHIPLVAELIVSTVLFVAIYLALLFIFEQQELLFLKRTIKDYLGARKGQ